MGRKKVFLAHDTTLDRDVAFALIKTEGLDAVSRERITREAQAMGRLRDHPHIVPIFDSGEETDPTSGATQDDRGRVHGVDRLESVYRVTRRGPIVDVAKQPRRVRRYY